jgi:segregation and condensation protein A
MDDDYRVQQEAYSGPLDLLLYLVRRQEVDLRQVSIRRLTVDYLEHLAEMQERISPASEFLVMASTLLEIKSALLMPPPAEDEEDRQGSDAAGGAAIDPRSDLIRQLMAYQRYRQAAEALRRRAEDWQRRHPVGPLGQAEHPPPANDGSEDDGTPPLELEDASISDLCNAFARLMRSVGHTKPRHEVVYDETPVSLYAVDVLDRLRRDGPMSLRGLFSGRVHRGELVGLFLATLELVRRGRVRVAQEEQDQDLRLEPTEPEGGEIDETGWQEMDEPAESAETAAAASTDSIPQVPPPTEGAPVDYDWPTPELQRRAERRRQRREALAASEEDADEPAPPEQGVARGQPQPHDPSTQADPPMAPPDETR